MPQYILWTCQFIIWKSHWTELYQRHCLTLSLHLNWEQAVYYSEIPIRNKDSSTILKRQKTYPSEHLLPLIFQPPKFQVLIILPINCKQQSNSPSYKVHILKIFCTILKRSTLSDLTNIEILTKRIHIKR